MTEYVAKVGPHTGGGRKPWKVTIDAEGVKDWAVFRALGQWELDPSLLWRSGASQRVVCSAWTELGAKRRAARAVQQAKRREARERRVHAENEERRARMKTTEFRT